MVPKRIGHLGNVVLTGTLTSVEGASGSNADALVRVLSTGVRAASPVDLLAVALSRRDSDVSSDQGRATLERFRNVRGLAEASRGDIQTITGLDEFEVLRFQAAMELGRRVGTSSKGPGDIISGPDDVLPMLDYLRFEKREHFVALLLDARSTLLRLCTIHVGTLTMSVVGAREVFREAIGDGAASIIVAHNHPSGDPTPSPEDLDVTHRLVEVGEMLDIPVLDHIVIGERRHASLSKMGLMQARKP